MASPAFARNGGYRSGRSVMNSAGVGSSQASDVNASAIGGGGAGAGSGGIGQSNYAEEKGASASVFGSWSTARGWR